jgi:hypothetical protein
MASAVPFFFIYKAITMVTLQLNTYTMIIDISIKASSKLYAARYNVFGVTLHGNNNIHKIKQFYSDF